MASDRLNSWKVAGTVPAPCRAVEGPWHRAVADLVYLRALLAWLEGDTDLARETLDRAMSAVEPEHALAYLRAFTVVSSGRFLSID